MVPFKGATGVCKTVHMGDIKGDIKAYAGVSVSEI